MKTDTKPGAYFVSVNNGKVYQLLAGPFVDDHASALACVDDIRRIATELDPQAVFYAFGTARVDHDHPSATVPGKLNGYLAAPGVVQ